MGSLLLADARYRSWAKNGPEQTYTLANGGANAIVSVPYLPRSSRILNPVFAISTGATQQTMIDKPRRVSRPSAASDAALGYSTVAKVGLELVGAGALGGVFVDWARERFAKVRESMQREGEQRIDDFFAELFRGNTSLENDVAKVFLDDADFSALLRACIADIEAEKTEAYACMTRAIATNQVERLARRHCILALRDLGAEELQHLRWALIAKRSGFSSSQRAFRSEAEILDPGEPGGRRWVAIRNLENRGLVVDGKLSPIGEIFTSACWRPEKLTPTSE